MLPYALIQSCERENLLMPPERLSGELFLGFDVARKKHLSVIYVLEKSEGAYSARHLRVMKNVPWSEQESALWELLALPGMRRACIDASGLGDQLTERARERFGSKAEAVKFTGAVKEDLAISLEKAFQDMSLLIPKDGQQRESLHSVRKVVTSAGNTRYDAAETEAGHGDHFWALALALHAAGKCKGMGWAVSGNPWERSESAESVFRAF
jgi:phage FluMu gp28-like protein